MDAGDKLIRARVQVMKKNPFFAYLSMKLNFSEGNLPPGCGAGVNLKGDFVYDKGFIDSLTNDQTIGVMLHEVSHLSLLHLLRRNNRDPLLWNLAADTVVNCFLLENGYELPEGTIQPNRANNYTVTLLGVNITDCNKKFAEEIYDELEKNVKKVKVKTPWGSQGSSDGDGISSGDSDEEQEEQPKSKPRKNNKFFDENGRFDSHIEGDGEGNQLDPQTKAELEQKWLSAVEEAFVSAKMKGDIPAGIERLIGKLHESKINWRVLLQRYIKNLIPFNYSWDKPHKRSFSVGCYLPYVEKEMVDVVIGVDLSGSIGQEEMVDFISEQLAMAKAFKGRIRFRLLTHDVDVQNDYVIKPYEADKIKTLKLKGGGGTSHVPIFNYIKEKVKNCDLAIFLTDGFSDIEEIKLREYPFKKMFVISKDGRKPEIKTKDARILTMDGKYL